MSEPFIGEIRMFGGNFAPRGWAFCQGQILSIAQNTALFSILGTTYGGNGQTTYALPDLRGRMPVGTGQGPGLPITILGQMAGSPTHTLLTTEMPAHVHSLQGTIKGSTAEGGNDSIPTGNVPGTGGTYNPTADTQMAPNMVTGSTSIVGGSQPFSIMPPYLGINFIIALEGIYPSRN